MEGDLEFLTRDRKVVKDPLKADVAKIAYVRVTHRFQKNGDHGEKVRVEVPVRILGKAKTPIKVGEKVIHAANHADEQLCIVRAYLRTLERARRLGVDPVNEPLAVYRQNRGSREPSWLTKDHVAKHLKAVARETYDIPDDVKVKYTAHSIRVGAACLMHMGGAEAHDIQKQLRWRSDTFRTYLRHMPENALRHLQMFRIADSLVAEDGDNF